MRASKRPITSFKMPEISSEIAIGENFILPDKYPLITPPAQTNRTEGAIEYIARVAFGFPIALANASAPKRKNASKIAPKTKKNLNAERNAASPVPWVSASLFATKIDIALGIPAVPIT